MDRRKLPIGIETFREIREDDCYCYVDKTPFIESLLEGDKHYFLSRPRRFGKSLLVDTLKELFEGSEELFEGLAIHERWTRFARHPVVRLDFSSGSSRASTTSTPRSRTSSTSPPRTPGSNWPDAPRRSGSGS